VRVVVLMDRPQNSIPHILRLLQRTYLVSDGREPCIYDPTDLSDGDLIFTFESLALATISCDTCWHRRRWLSVGIYTASRKRPLVLPRSGPRGDSATRDQVDLAREKAARTRVAMCGQSIAQVRSHPAARTDKFYLRAANRKTDPI
jgi:hypothetical protein